MRCEAECAHLPEHILRQLVSRTEGAQSLSECVAEKLRRLRLLVALPERERQVDRRDQRLLVICAEQAGLLDEDLALDLHCLGVLVLP